MTQPARSLQPMVHLHAPCGTVPCAVRTAGCWACWRWRWTRGARAAACTSHTSTTSPSRRSESRACRSAATCTRRRWGGAAWAGTVDTCVLLLGCVIGVLVFGEVRTWAELDYSGRVRPSRPVTQTCRTASCSASAHAAFAIALGVSSVRLTSHGDAHPAVAALSIAVVYRPCMAGCVAWAGASSARGPALLLEPRCCTAPACCRSLPVRVWGFWKGFRKLACRWARAESSGMYRTCPLLGAVQQHTVWHPMLAASQVGLFQLLAK